MSKLMFAFVLISTMVGTSIANEIPRTITVTGQGKAASPPDMATINSGVATTAATAKEALAANNVAMEKLMEVLKSRGIESKDIQTSGFGVYPEYARRNPGQRGSNNEARITGYRVNNNVTVRVRNLPRLGEILDALVDSGSNRISGVSFSISEPRAIQNKARMDAVDDARGRAELYAQATGARVGKVIAISEQPIRRPQPAFGARMAMVSEVASSVPVATGEQQVSATVNVIYELLDK